MKPSIASQEKRGAIRFVAERHRARNTRVFGSSGSGRSNTEVETGFSLRQLRDLYVQVTICTPAIRAALCKS